MRALTIDAYWAWAIAHGTKRVENRSWRTDYRGPLAIHAGRDTTRDRHAIDAIRTIHPASLAGWVDAHEIRGHVIAVCELVDVVRPDDLFLAEGQRAWACGPWCWVLENVRPLAEPIAARGMQGLWEWAAHELHE